MEVMGFGWDSKHWAKSLTRILRLISAIYFNCSPQQQQTWKLDKMKVQVPNVGQAIAYGWDWKP